jgi:DNA-binding GntR family transcriptional regulator
MSKGVRPHVPHLTSSVARRSILEGPSPAFGRIAAVAAPSLVEAAYDRLRHDIILGLLEPETKLRIDDLRERYGLGATPLREALARLSAVGLVDATSQRGFRVSRVSVEDLDDVTELRVKLESELLRQSIENGDDAWEARVAGAFHSLAKLESQGLPLDAETFGRWEQRNRAFHEALIESATSRWTLRFRSMIYDHHERYRRIAHLVANRAFDVRQEHAQICEAALARDADTAVRISAEHIRRTGLAIREQLALPPT